MEFIKYFVISFLSLCALVVFIFCVKSGKPIKCLFLNAAIGIASFIAVNLLSGFTGIHIAVNPYTVSGSAVFGIPALFGFLTANLIF